MAPQTVAPLHSPSKATDPVHPAGSCGLCARSLHPKLGPFTAPNPMTHLQPPKTDRPFAPPPPNPTALPTPCTTPTPRHPQPAHRAHPTSIAPRPSNQRYFSRLPPPRQLPPPQLLRLFPPDAGGGRLPGAALEPPAAAGPARVRPVLGGHKPQPPPLRRARAARSQVGGTTPPRGASPP